MRMTLHHSHFLVPPSRHYSANPKLLDAMRTMPLPQAIHPLDAEGPADPLSHLQQAESHFSSPSCVERCKELTESCSTDKDFEISPSSIPDTSSPQARTPIPANIAPWETARNNNDFTNYRRDLAVVDGFSNKVPSINRQPPSASSPTVPWGNGNVMPTSVLDTFYDDPNEDIGQLSPGFRPGSSQEDMAGYEDDRRPSIASATTVSSTGSKSSVGRGIHKRLHHFFGEDIPSDGRQGSDTSLPPLTIHSTTSTADPRITQPVPRNRTNSTNNSAFVPTISRPGSPSSFARPRTPHTSEVTPWEFQDYKVSRTSSK
jgi:adenylate cyclase